MIILKNKVKEIYSYNYNENTYNLEEKINKFIEEETKCKLYKLINELNYDTDTLTL